ncbi:6817_t:CDS:2, partial [Entrophospora sp. SA101]
YISNVPKSLNDSRNPFKAGDLVEVREEIKYVETPKKYWRRPIITKYNELKCCNYNPESKYYTTDKINNFIKEIEEIKAESTQDNS